MQLLTAIKPKKAACLFTSELKTYRLSAIYDILDRSVSKREKSDATVVTLVTKILRTENRGSDDDTYF